MEQHLKDALEIRDFAVKNNGMFNDSIPLIASENIMSPLAMEMLLTDFGHRYAIRQKSHISSSQTYVPLL